MAIRSSNPPPSKHSKSINLELRFVFVVFLITTIIVTLSCFGIYFLHKKGVLRVAEKEFYSKTVSINIPLQHLFRHSTEHNEKFQPIIQPFLNEIQTANFDQLKAIFIHDQHQQVLLATSQQLPTALNHINFDTFQKSPVFVIDKSLMVITMPMNIKDRTYFLTTMFTLKRHFEAVQTNLIQPLIYIAITYIFIIVFLAFVVAKKMIQPLKKMTRAIKRSFPGQDNTVRSATKLNEFGQLELLFQELLEHLENHHHEEKRIQLSLMQTDKLVTIGTLAAGVAHEINNPITGMQSCMAHLKKLCEHQEKALRYIEPVDQSIVHIKKAVAGLLDYSKVRNYLFEPVSIFDVLTQVEQVVSSQLEQKKISLVVDLPENQYCGTWDINALKQVIMNLVLNAIYAINSDNGSITISGFRKKNILLLHIHDNGPGIPTDIIHKIFNPFFTTKAQGKGTGLGLAVCRNIIDAHQGSVSVISEPQKGTTFTITLPLLSEDRT
ncbi:MAG: HAMP domain-containing histidine kinase [Fibrobacterales bacterium]